MGRDVDDNLLPQGKGTSAMTVNIVWHSKVCWRVARHRRTISKIADNRSNLDQRASKPWTIGQMLRQTKTELEKGTIHASLTLPNEPIWGISVNSCAAPCSAVLAL